MVDWPHAPLHRIDDAGAYFITAGTYGKEHCFRQPARLDYLRDLLFDSASRFHVELQAWALFSNHYHFVAVTPREPAALRRMIAALHQQSAFHVNRADGTPGRTVWYQFWDKQLTFQRSYMARLNYVHGNPVHHRVVEVAENYPWCSARWFRDSVSASYYESLRRFRTDRMDVPDEYGVLADCGDVPHPRPKR